MAFVWETPEEINQKLAQRLKLLRKRRGISQLQLSKKATSAMAASSVLKPPARSR